MTPKKGRLISIIGPTGIGKSYSIGEIIKKNITEGKRVLYLSQKSPNIKHLTLFIIRGGDTRQIIEHITNNKNNFDMFVVDFSESENNIDKKHIMEFKNIIEEFNVDVILSAQGRPKENLDHSKLYSLSDIVIYPNKNISTRIDLPNNNVFNVSDLV